ncbi:MAG: hypothetical protein KF866_09575 [Phycisphaeraceae bacterium]|nr:hypothetical protein [Phycisphaeraceae bacterium]MCW5754747.1 hypothetical protein [Phycisphaeraceae bacterium]
MPTTDHPSPKVCWIFSLARCGSSIAAYAAAAPWGIPVADEPFGPWDRTGPPYHYPPEQKTLKELYWAVGEHLTPAVVHLADVVFRKIAAGMPTVISKHPHDMIRPAEFAREFPHHKSVFLLRNPLLRLNSLYARQWIKAIGPNHDLDRYKLVARRSLHASHRLMYEDLRRNPAAFFRTLWEAWEWPYTQADLEAALTYQKNNYHASSRALGERSTDKVLSEERWAVPDQALTEYLADDFISGFMRDHGWSTDPDYYRQMQFRTPPQPA